MDKRQTGNKKKGKAMVAMCSAAIGTIYLSAYWVTSSQPGSEAAAYAAVAASSESVNPLTAATSLPPSLPPGPAAEDMTRPAMSRVAASPVPSDLKGSSDNAWLGLQSGHGIAAESSPGPQKSTVPPPTPSATTSVSSLAPAPVPSTAPAAPPSSTANALLSSPSRTPSPSTAPKSSASPSSKPASPAYKDGTYNGTGTNRIGSVEVTVSIKNNKITDVKITRCTTRYPQRLIDPMPAQVVERQSEQVDVVSGATLSTRNFTTAVHQALTQALQGA